MQKIIRGYPLAQGYSNGDETHSAGLPAAGEGKMLFTCHTYEIFVPLKKGVV
jgi:hypothetical protein